MSRSWPKLILPVLIAVLAVVWCVRSGKSPPSAVTSPPPGVAGGGSGGAGGVALAPDESCPLLEGLKTGDQVGEWQITRILVNESVEKKPQLAVEMERKGSGITIWVARKENVKNPPVVTQKYALTFGHPRPYGEPIPPDAFETMLQKIADRVRKSEADAPVPAGL
ncbi:MAG: hypothetical protein ACXVEF_25655 [Polyangiales bacterium]